MKYLKIVYFEDDIGTFRALEDTLHGLEAQLIHVTRSEESFSKIKTLKPDVILVELRSSTRNHYDLLFKMDTLEDLSNIPKIVITDAKQSYELLWSPQNPFWDYIAHPVDAPELIERIHFWLEKINLSQSQLPSKRKSK